MVFIQRLNNKVNMEQKNSLLQLAHFSNHPRTSDTAEFIRPGLSLSIELPVLTLSMFIYKFTYLMTHFTLIHHVSTDINDCKASFQAVDLPYLRDQAHLAN